MYIGNFLNVLAGLAKGPTDKYTCGNLDVGFNGIFPYLVSTIYLVLRIAIPILLIIFGLLDLAKAVTSQKEDEIKKGQQILVKRFITAAIVFFVFIIVDLMVGLLAGDDEKNIMNCVNCFLTGDVAADKCVKK